VSLPSAWLLLCNRPDGTLSALLVHPCGPFWRNKDAGARQIPKGLVETEEGALAAALREASEELGTDFRKAVHLQYFRLLQDIHFHSSTTKESC